MKYKTIRYTVSKEKYKQPIQLPANLHSCLHHILMFTNKMTPLYSNFKEHKQIHRKISQTIPSLFLINGNMFPSLISILTQDLFIILPS